MFTISVLPAPETGYKIGTGDGMPVKADNALELKCAVDHYFGDVEHKTDDAENDYCPFCKWARTTGKRRAS